MGKITVSLIRRRAEHNEGEIQSLEEISLHQEKLEKIELLDKICKNLKILLLQNNSIAKIENLSRLKYLEYLNLALNMVEKIENLDGCESLKKLDLTLNFIGRLSSVEALKPNYFLEQLYLVGNPCHDYPGYRDYVIAMLPQLKQLDGVDITKSERLQAKQNFEEIEATVLLHQEAYLREKQIAKKSSKKATKVDENKSEDDSVQAKKSSSKKVSKINDGNKSEEDSAQAQAKKSSSKKANKVDEENKNEDDSIEKRPKTAKSDKITPQKSESEKSKQDEEKVKETEGEKVEEKDDGFWEQVTENTPEARLEMNQRLEKQEAEKAATKQSPLPPKLPRKLETDDGRPLNANEPKLSFTLHDEMERNQIVLDLAVPRFLCTTLIDADVQPTYVRVTVKGKVFQLVLPEEVKPDSSYAQRSQTTGHLIVTMPKVHEHSVLIWRGGSGPVIELKKSDSNIGQQASKALPRPSHGDKSKAIKSDKKSEKVDKHPTNPKRTETATIVASGTSAQPKTTSSSKSSKVTTSKLPQATPPAPLTKSKASSNNAESHSKKKHAKVGGSGNNKTQTSPVPATPTPVKGRGSTESTASYSNRKMTSAQLLAFNLSDVPPLI